MPDGIEKTIDNVSHLKSTVELSPGARLLEAIERRGYTKIKFSQLIDYSRTTLYALLNDEQRITPDVSAAIGKVFGESPTRWLDIQRDWDKRYGGDEAGSSRSSRRTDDFVLVDSDIRDIINNGAIRVEPAPDLHQIQPASLDLRLDDCLPVHGVSARFEGARLTLPPKSCVVVVTRESIAMPPDMMAYVGGTTNLLKSGIGLLSGLMVDPGYEGRLTLGLQNLLDCDVVINRGDIVASLSFHRLSKAPQKPYSARGRVKKGFLGELLGEDFAVDGLGVYTVDAGAERFIAQVQDTHLKVFGRTAAEAEKLLCEDILCILDEADSSDDDPDAQYILSNVRRRTSAEKVDVVTLYEEHLGMELRNDGPNVTRGVVKADDGPEKIRITVPSRATAEKANEGDLAAFLDVDLSDVRAIVSSSDPKAALFAVLRGNGRRRNSSAAATD